MEDSVLTLIVSILFPRHLLTFNIFFLPFHLISLSLLSNLLYHSYTISYTFYSRHSFFFITYTPIHLPLDLFTSLTVVLITIFLTLTLFSSSPSLSLSFFSSFLSLFLSILSFFPSLSLFFFSSFPFLFLLFLSLLFYHSVVKTSYLHCSSFYPCMGREKENLRGTWHARSNSTHQV